MNGDFSCNSFAEIDWTSYEQALREGVKREVQELTKDYVLGVDEAEYKNHLVSRFELVPLEILKDSEHVSEPRIAKQPFQDIFGNTGYRDGYVFEVQYQFHGTGALFRVKPSSWVMTTHEICVSPGNNIVSFEIAIMQKDSQEFLRLKQEAFGESFRNVARINQEVTTWNQALPATVTAIFDARKKHFAAENDFFAAINVAPNPKTQGLFTVPTVKRQVVPRPSVSGKKQFSREPTMADEMYEDVLKILYQAGQGMERKPALYRNKREEDVRDQFLLFLETRYASTTGTSETFNKEGKTDILLRYEDGTNLFVAECKWWTGEKDFHAAIDQLFDRYLTWRDSKAAILMFVDNKAFSPVLQKIRTSATKHPYFKRILTDRAETSLAFDFHFPGDVDRLVKLGILVFLFA